LKILGVYSLKVNKKLQRRIFAMHLVSGVKIVWPILSVLVVLIMGLGLLIGFLEGWLMHESIYFSLITGLTVGYGDFAPHDPISRCLSVIIGLCGMLFTALISAIAVKALTKTLDI
jgi:hypothetical protein